MRLAHPTPLALAGLLGLALAHPVLAESDRMPVAGHTPAGISTSEMAVVAAGWSARRTFLGHRVFDTEGKAIGTVEDLIITPEKALSYAIIGAGGFLGMDKHDVAIPVARLVQVDDRLVLPGATKESLMAMPEFQYAQRPRSERSRVEKPPASMERPLPGTERDR